MRNIIIIFTLRGCFHCKVLKSKLNQENIGLTEIEVSDNQKIWDQVEIGFQQKNEWKV